MSSHNDQPILSSHRDNDIAQQIIPTPEDPHNWSSKSRITNLAVRGSEFVSGVKMLDFAVLSTGSDASDKHGNQIINSEDFRASDYLGAIQSPRTSPHVAALLPTNPLTSSTELIRDEKHTGVHSYVYEKPVFSSCSSTSENDCLTHVGVNLASESIAVDDLPLKPMESEKFPGATVPRHTGILSSTEMVGNADLIDGELLDQTESRLLTYMPEDIPSLDWRQEQERKLAALGVTGTPKPVTGYVPPNAVPYYTISDIDLSQYEQRLEFVASTRSDTNGQAHAWPQRGCLDTSLHEPPIDCHLSSQNHCRKRLRYVDNSTSAPAPKRSRCFISNRGTAQQNQ